MHNNLEKLTFQNFQQSKNYFSLTHKFLSLQLKTFSGIFIWYRFITKLFA